MDIVGCDFVNPFNYMYCINPTEPMGDFISSSNKHSDEDPLLMPGEPFNGCQNDFESINDTMTGANDSDQGHNRQRSNGVRDSSGEHAHRDQTGWEVSFCCCITPDYHSKEADNTTGNKSVPIQKQPISVISDQYNAMQKENGYHQSYSDELEAHKKELKGEGQAKCGEAGDTATQLKGGEETKATTSSNTLVTIEEIPTHILREQELQRQNDILRRKVAQLEKRELKPEEQLQDVITDVEQSRLRNVEKTTVTHSIASIEYPDESMRTDQVARLQRENDELRRRLIDLEANEKALHRQLQKVNDDGDEARKRLSEMMSNRLTDNNPNIADLGDKYRPANLAELMSELYDNQWTEAFNYFEETWQGEFSELACLNFLLNVIMEVYTFCSRKVSEEWTAAIKSFSLSTEKDRVLLKQLKDKRKTISLETYPRILKSCLETFKHLPLSNDPGFDITLEAKAVREYLQECVRLCWLMVVQDPPVYLYCYGWESSQPGPWLVYSREQVKAHYESQANGNATHNEHQGHIDCPDDTNEETNCDGQVNRNAARNEHQDLIDGPDGINDRDDKPETRDDGGAVLKTHESGIRNRVLFNKDHYREYTKRGAYLKYVVWPIVFLFEGGTVLQKGVAQGGD